MLRSSFFFGTTLLAFLGSSLFTSDASAAPPLSSSSASSSSSAEGDGSSTIRGFGLTLRGIAAYPLAAGLSLGAEVNPTRSVAVELALGATGPLFNRDGEGGLDAMLGVRLAIDPDTSARPYVALGAHYRSAGGTYGGDVSVSRSFLGGYTGLGFEVPLSQTFVLRAEALGSFTPRLAVAEDTRGDDFRAQLRINFGVTAYF